MPNLEWGSGKAEAIEHFVKEYPADRIQQIAVDEHLTTKQIHNLEKLTELQVIDRERLILNIFLRELLQPNQNSKFNSQK